MGEVEKPFGCPQPGCGQSFANEDHLTVHQRRHEMLLSVESGDHTATTLVKNHSLIIDQTPTPTRFLRPCDEVTLFQEVDLNPFDEQFRKASQYHSSHINHSEIVNSSTTGSLETPRILPPVDSDETISSTSRDDPHISPSLSTPIISIGNVTPTISSTYRHQNVPHTTRTLANDDTRASKLEGKHNKLHVNISSAAEASQQSSNVISTPTPVITAGPSVTQSLGTNNISSASVIETSVITDLKTPLTPGTIRNTTHPTSSVPPSPSATVLQLVLRLPNGEAIPVEIPATPVVSSSCESMPSVVTSISSASHQSVHQSSLAKIKLKQALASSNTAARPGNSKISRANTADRIAEMTRSRYHSGTSSNEGDYNDDTTESLFSNSSNGRRRRSSLSDDDPTEKRRKFLERNRAAAIRCREKKKRWVQNLAYKSDELSAINQRLQSEVSNLRSEVATLKSMLLQHKDCPVTLAMQDGETDELMPLPPGQQALARYRKTKPPSQKSRPRSFSLPALSPENGSSPVNLSCNDAGNIMADSRVKNILGTDIGSSIVVHPTSTLKILPQQISINSSVVTPARLVIGSPTNNNSQTCTIITQEEVDSSVKTTISSPSFLKTNISTATPQVNLISNTQQIPKCALPKLSVQPKLSIHHRRKQ